MRGSAIPRDYSRHNIVVRSKNDNFIFNGSGNSAAVTVSDNGDQLHTEVGNGISAQR